MKDKQLKEKAIDIKGKKYILVSDRVIFFNSEYPNGSIVSEKSESGDRVDFKTTITPDVANPRRIFTGHSQAVWGDGYINKSSATENAETSAVGRALAMMAIGVIDSIASIDEIKKAENTAKIIPLKKIATNNLLTKKNQVVDLLTKGGYINDKTTKEEIADKIKSLTELEAVDSNIDEVLERIKLRMNI